MRSRLTLVSLFAVTAALALPATALARTTRVAPFKSVAGIPLKLTPKQVRHRLGRPSHTDRVGGKIASYEYPHLALTVQFDTLHHPVRSDFVGVAVGFATPNIRYHTAHGIHIGSSKKAVRHAFGKQCHWNLGDCAIWRGKPGAIGSTRFDIGFEQGKVAQFDNQYDFNDL